MENKKIKVIDLLNMMAKGEYDKLPKKIKLNKIYEAEFKEDSYYFSSSDGYEYVSIWSSSLLNEEIEIIEEPILTDKEKEYLSAVIKPFRDKVEFVQKYIENPYTEESHIFILIKSGGVLIFPSFDANAMYKEMKKDKKYTLRELGL